MGRVITYCQSCGSGGLELCFSAGLIPQVNSMRKVGMKLLEQMLYPAQLYKCMICSLVQLGYEADQREIFPSDYAYRSGTTKALKENFKDLAKEVMSLYPMDSYSVVVDIGSNDGTLLKEFWNYTTQFKLVGIEPTAAALDARKAGITSYMEYFSGAVVEKIIKNYGKASLVTACNVFAHIPYPNEVVENIKELLGDKGIFVSESHYLPSLLATVQYDTIYHEHLRYYSLRSLSYLLRNHGMEIIRAKKISTHGGSIRVYAARDGDYPVRESVSLLLAEEEGYLNHITWADFNDKAVYSKLNLLYMLNGLRLSGKRIVGIGCPSRAVTLIHYCRIDEAALDYIAEVPGSPKIGNYVPGTMIPVEDEARLYREQPDYALLLSWHLADELVWKIKEKGFNGKFIIPLPVPRVM